MTIRYMDYVNGDNANGGTSWADAKRTIQGFTADILEPGDIIRIAKSPAPVSIGNGTWTNLSKVVTLATAQTLNVDLCEVAWTAANGATVTRDAVATDAKEGSYCMRVTAPSSPATNTKYAYYATGSLDLSSYQKLSFWIKNQAAVLANHWKICLCSDVAGDTIVDTFEIPAIPYYARWLPLTLSRVGGGNLGSAIQSIALYSSTVAPTGSKYLRLDNFIACTTNGLNLQSLISKNSAEQGGTEGWYAIQSINGVTILLDDNPNTKSTAGRGYSGTTEIVITYKRETIKTDLSSTLWGIIQQVMDSGASENNIQFQGGYNISTTEQDGETFFDGLQGVGYGIYLASVNYITLNYLNAYRYNDGLYIEDTSGGIIIDTISNLSNNNSAGIDFGWGCKNVTINTISNANNNYNGIYGYSCVNFIIGTITNVNNNNDSGFRLEEFNNNTITTISNINNNGYSGFYLSISGNNVITTIVNVNNNYSAGLYFGSSSNNLITTIVNVNNNAYGVIFYAALDNIIQAITNANNNNAYGVSFNYGACNNIIKSISTTGNSTAGIRNYGRNYLYNALIAEGIEVITSSLYTNSRIFSQNHNQGTNHRIFTDGGQIDSVATDRPGGTGIMWKLAITSENRGIDYPLDLSIAKIAVLANKLVTVKVYMKKDHATNVGGKLVCRGGQIAGVPNNVVDTKADDLNWEELTITFTPTEVGVIEIKAWAYYLVANANIYVEDMTITQAD